MSKRLLTITLGLALATLAGGTSARAQTTDPASLPAHDSHQGLLVAVDPYLTAARYKTKFGKQHTPYEAGIVGLEVFFRNDNDAPVRLNLGTIRLLINSPGGSHQRIETLSPEDVADRVLLKPEKTPPRGRPTIMLPGSVGKGNRNKDWEELDGTLRSLTLSTDVLPPHSTTHGFFFFDVAGHFDWLSDSRFEVPDLAFMLDNKALFFFEVDLAPAAH